MISLTPYIVQQIHTITNTSNMQIEIDDIYFLTHIFLVLTDYGASPLVTDLCFSQLIFAVASKLISWTYFQIDKKTVDQATVVDAICEITGCLRLIGTSEKSANLFDLSSLEKPIRAIISTEIVSNLLSYHFKNTVSRNADELGCGWHLLWSILFACHTKKPKSRTESTEYGKFLQNVVLKHWEAEYYSSQVYHNLSIFNTKGFITFQGALLDPELNSEKILGALKLLTNYAETSGVLSKDNQEICVSPNQTYVSANELKVDSEVANSVECINAVLIKILREKLGLEIISDCLPSWNNSVFLRRKDKNCVTSLHSDTGYLREHMSQDVSSVNDLDCCINVWIPLGTVSPSSGDSCLLIVPESHMDKERWDFNDQDRIKKSRHCRKSVVPFPCNCKQECCSGNGSEVDKRQSLFAFHQGDIVILSSSCLHEARPHSNKKRPRISIDFRFKIAFPASQYRSAFTLFM